MHIILEVQHTMFKSHAITKITNGLAYYTPHNVYPNSAFCICKEIHNNELLNTRPPLSPLILSQIWDSHQSIMAINVR